jgi:hypothetical protein
MARIAQEKTAPDSIVVCPFCKAARQGGGLLKHCLDKHRGQVPLIVCGSAREYAAAAAVLRKAKFKVTALTGCA